MTNKCKKQLERRLTSSTVRGMHILYSFSNIFPGALNLCGFTMCQTSRVNVPSADRRDVCNFWRRVSACGVLWDGEPGLWNTPRGTTEFFHQNLRTLAPAGDVRSEMSSVQGCPLLSHRRVKLRGSSCERDRKT